MGFANLWYSRPRKYGPGSRSCRVCSNHHGLIRKYGLNVCRRCFRDYSDKIGFKKVCVAGLDTEHNEAHHSVWNALSQQRAADRLPLHFVAISDEHVFPLKKAPRGSSEPSRPQGILKSDWLRKHQETIPAVVVLFFDMDWNDLNWAHKLLLCQTKVHKIRESLQGRNSRFCVVLLQRGAPMPAGEDVLAAQRATELCTTCDISPKALFVLPHAEHQFGYILRLEQAFHDLAQAYYAAEIRRVKSKKDLLGKSSHLALLVRCQFKLAVFNELRQDSHTALRHYKLAYQHLTESPSPEVLWLEHKTVGALLNYHICRLCFAHSTPLDAISHFRRHSEYWSTRVGSVPSQAVARLQHHAWMTTQYASFGEQFDAAVQGGLAAIQTQHPGFYFQSAAQHAISRRALLTSVAREIRTTGAVYPEQDDPLQSSTPAQYCGQPVWLQQQNTQLAQENSLDEQLMARVALALTIKETQQDLSAPVLQCVNAALQQFKRYRCARMCRYMRVLLADEYVQMQQMAKALQLYTHVIWEYRHERWLCLVRVLCERALVCAYELVNVNEYMCLCLQLLNTAHYNTLNTPRIANNMQTFAFFWMMCIALFRSGLLSRLLVAQHSTWISDPDSLTEKIASGEAYLIDREVAPITIELLTRHQPKLKEALLKNPVVSVKEQDLVEYLAKHPEQAVLVRWTTYIWSRTYNRSNVATLDQPTVPRIKITIFCNQFVDRVILSELCNAIRRQHKHIDMIREQYQKRLRWMKVCLTHRRPIATSAYANRPFTYRFKPLQVIHLAGEILLLVSSMVIAGMLCGAEWIVHYVLVTTSNLNSQ